MRQLLTEHMVLYRATVETCVFSPLVLLPVQSPSQRIDGYKFPQKNCRKPRVSLPAIHAVSSHQTRDLRSQFRRISVEQICFLSSFPFPFRLIETFDENRDQCHWLELRRVTWRTSRHLIELSIPNENRDLLYFRNSLQTADVTAWVLIGLYIVSELISKDSSVIFRCSWLHSAQNECVILLWPCTLWPHSSNCLFRNTLYYLLVGIASYCCRMIRLDFLTPLRLGFDFSSIISLMHGTLFVCRVFGLKSPSYRRWRSLKLRTVRKCDLWGRFNITGMRYEPMSQRWRAASLATRPLCYLILICRCVPSA